MNKRTQIDHNEFLPVLMDRALSGDSHAEEELWQQMIKVVHKYSEIICQKKHVGESEVEDIVQNSMISIMSVLRNTPSRLQAIGKWSSWLYRVVDNKVNDHLRWIRNRQTISLDKSFNDSEENTATLLDFLPSNVSGPEDKAGQRQMIKAAIKLISGLSKERQDVFRLYIQGMTQKEIAEHTGLPQTTVNNYIYRMLNKLRDFRDNQEN